jgi:inner membrane protein
MDPLTHTATGLFLSRAGLKRWTPLATPILLVAANAPDADIVTAAGGPLAYLHYHRHLTHSLIAMPVMALLAVAVVRLAARKPIRWPGAFAAALIAVGSHLLLDLTNAYGVRLLLPFSGKWFEGDLTSVVDLWIWAVILLAVAGPLIGRLVGAEISSGTIRTRAHGRGFAIFALAFLLLYNGGRAVLHGRAEAIANARLYRGRPAERLAALPNAANPWQWRVVAATADFYAVTDVNLLADFDPTQAAIFHKPDPDAAMEAARHTATFREFLRFSQFPLWRSSPAAEPDDARLVEVLDLRFGTPLDPGFIAGAVINARQQPVDTWFHFGRPRPR